jgi:GTP-binding protein
MIPVIAIVGRPNVGKSTLFNQLTKSREALVFDMPGVTRDRQYGPGKVGNRPFIVIDTGGLGGQEGIGMVKPPRAAPLNIASSVGSKMIEQSWQAVEEADMVFFLVDARVGRTAEDESIANALRRHQKPVYLVVNKVDGLETNTATADFFALGLGMPIPIAASHGRGTVQLVEHALEAYPETEESTTIVDHGIKIAIVGRPNVGKSTLVNRILGEDRVIVFDEPGTTRDSIYIPFTRRQQKYIIIDTAGIRRRAKISEAVEKYSVVKTLQAIDNCHVAILVMDAAAGITDQDLGLLGFIIEAGKALVIALNKWDGLTPQEREKIKQTLNHRLAFAEFAKIHFISALHGTNVGNLFDSVLKAYASASKQLTTALLTKILQKAVALHHPPMIRGRRIKLRYAHAGGRHPPIIVIHGNQTHEIPQSYRRYLSHAFGKELKMEGTPIRIEFKTGENPYAERGLRQKRLTGFRKRKQT